MDAEHPSSGETRWRVVPTTAWTHADDGTAVVMDMAGGIPLRLSPTGSLIWDVLLGGRTPQEDLTAPPPTPLAEDDVVAQVAAAVGEEPLTVAADVRLFLSVLAERGILERDV